MDSTSLILLLAFFAFRLDRSSGNRVLRSSRWGCLIIAAFLLPSVSFAEEIQSATQLLDVQVFKLFAA